MPFQSGARLGPYEIVSPLGAGGMGEVYRARDATLNRDVALKVLLDAVVSDPQRLARFKREAHVLASLNHPHIAHLYGFEEGPPTSFLVMELVDGPTLADVIAAAPAGLPLDQALPIARQIAEALEAAHEQGVVHRDLKPANVKVRDDGVVKVLDFGLAKAVDPVSSSGVEATNSPTMTNRATQLGMILGTAAYMAPEQAKGKAVDKRADVWAFGVVLHEMLTGRRLFDADDISETLAAVLRQEIALSALPATTPPRLARLIGRCLERDPKQRLRDIGEARIELARLEAGGADVMEGPAAASAGSAAEAPRWRRMLPWALAVVMALIWIGTIGRAWITPEPRVASLQVSFPISTGDEQRGQPPVPEVSPDGTMVAFVAPQDAASAVKAVWIRPMNELEPRLLSGTEGAGTVFWSPNSRSIAFNTADKIKRVGVAGGSPQTICVVTGSFGGATWTPATPEAPGGNIIFSGAGGGGGRLFRVSADAGLPVEVARPDASRGESGLYFPWALPDGRRVLYVSGGTRATYVSSFDGTAPVRVPLPTDSKVTYAARGFLLFVKEGTLYAQRFDASALRLSGEAIPVADSVLIGPQGSRAAFSASQNGVLVYRPGTATEASKELVWLDRAGRSTRTIGSAGNYGQIRLSPDQKRVVIKESGPNDSRLSVLDLTTGIASTLTNDALGQPNEPVWSRDSNTVAFSALKEGKRQFLQHRVGESGEAVAYESPDAIKWLDDWSADGHWLLFHLPTPSKLYAASLTGDHELIQLLTTSETIEGAHFSPDTNWIAYQIRLAGTWQVWVAKFPKFNHQQRVSPGGGGQPFWGRRGLELYYLTPDGKLMAARVSLPDGDGPLGLSTPVELFRTPIEVPALNLDQYAPASDGQSFLFIRPRGDRQQVQPLTVKINWAAGLQ